MKRIKFLGLATGDPHEAAGKYLVSYDPDYHLPGGEYDGGALVTTPDPAAAARFASTLEAWRVWMAAPACKCHRLRADGKLNRPLTAFTIELSEEEAACARL